jgi:hypothetical protein
MGLRAVDVVRALAAFGAPTLALVGCDQIVEPIEADAAVDAGAHADARTVDGGVGDVDDAGDAAEVATPSGPGSCVVSGATTVVCETGGICAVDETSLLAVCASATDAGVLTPCGAIRCGFDCECGDPTTSACRCYPSSGPLAPPDLPSLRRG